MNLKLLQKHHLEKQGEKKITLKKKSLEKQVAQCQVPYTTKVSV
jgi:hypothetical protein